MEVAPPYIPLVEMLEAAARMFPPEALRDALGDSAPEVAKLMPELHRLFPDIPPPPELPPEQERRYLFNGMRDFLVRAGRAQPLLLVLDDLHWADDSTMLLVQHIAQQLHEMPVLIVGTYRDVELDVARPLARALEELLRQRLAHRISLRRLPEDGVSAMLRALSGQDHPAVAGTDTAQPCVASTERR
jgi:predicted ATPase